MRIPEPMLLRAGTLPLGSGYSYELKWDGFRALVSTVDGLLVQSRRGWNMTDLLPEFETMPAGLVLDGELVAFDDGKPSFPLLSSRLLHRNSDAPVTFVAFDVLYAHGEAATSLSFTERRSLLESIRLESPVYVGPTFDDGAALFDAVCRDGLEGIVAKRLRDPYKSGERAWVKIKTRATGAGRRRSRRCRRASGGASGAPFSAARGAIIGRPPRPRGPGGVPPDGASPLPSCNGRHAQAAV